MKINSIKRLKGLLQKRANNKLTHKEKEELLHFINSEENESIVSSEFYIQWNSSERTLPKYNPRNLFQQVRDKVNISEEQLKYDKRKWKTSHGKMHPFINIMKYAAIFIFGIITYIIYNQVYIDKEVVSGCGFNEVCVQYGSKSLVTLPDGTKVWLNSGSKIIYPDKFSEANREVALVGEAFFDVTRNEHKPFIVKTDNLDIKVLGTRFNVKSYPGDDYIETVLISGSIELHKQNGPTEEHILLKPNQKAVVYKTAKETQVQPVESKPEVIKPRSEPIVVETVEETTLITSWKDGELKFNAEPFHLLAEKMERWFDVEIIFENNNAKNIRYTGVFDNETVEQAMEALSISYSIQYTIEENKIYIHK